MTASVPGTVRLLKIMGMRGGRVTDLRDAPHMTHFTGRIEPNRHITVRYHLTGRPDFIGSAVLDTGAPYVLVSQALVERAGLEPLPGKTCEVWGLGGRGEIAMPVVYLDIELRGERGKTWRIHGEAAVSPVEGCDVILGLEILARGEFTIDGPARTWNWRIPEELRGIRLGL